jgi:hypothetical protein
MIKLKKSYVVELTEHHRKSHIKRYNLKPKEIVTKNE